ncbi:MAG TPA: hypothetical protein VGR89_00480 [Puia sp.]|nr:hypothetical protein [Puia sp.]
MADEKTEVAVVDASSRFVEKRAMLDTEASLQSNSLEAFIQEKVAAILDAPDFEAINALMTQTGMTSAKSLVGRTFEIRDLAIRESAPQYRNAMSKESYSALEKYGIVKGVDTSTGEEFIIDGGGDQFLAGLIAMRERYDFPFTGTLLGMVTGAGREMQYWRFSDPGRKPVA